MVSLAAFVKSERQIVSEISNSFGCVALSQTKSGFYYNSIDALRKSTERGVDEIYFRSPA